MGGSLTISQLKKSLRLHLPDIVFTSETKQKKRFVNIVCKRLKCKDRWEVVDPISRRWGLLLFRGEEVKVCQIVKSEFCMEMEFEGTDFVWKCWAIFIYASPDAMTRRRQYEFLKIRKNAWGQRWFLGGNCNDYASHDDKQGGNMRPESAFSPFRTFVRDMDMEAIFFRGRRWTWANNRAGERFIEERLD